MLAATKDIKRKVLHKISNTWGIMDKGWFSNSFPYENDTTFETS